MAGNASDILAYLNGKSPNPSANPNAGVGAQLSSDVNSSQQQFGANYATQRAQNLSGIDTASVGGTVPSDPLAVDPTQSNQNQQLANQNIAGITQRGQDATNAQQAAQSLQWNSQLQKMGTDYQTNSANAQTSYDQPSIDAMLQNMPAGADLNNQGAKAVALAKQSLGVNYVWGGNSLTQGVDCSGLVQQVYGKLGIQLPRTSTDQAKSGKIVPSLSQALPGDLILEYSPYEPVGLQQFGHVGIYIGNGQVIEAPGTGKQVRIGPIVNMTRIVRPY